MDNIKMWESFPGCTCLQHILCESGFENALSLKLITEDHINEIEKYIHTSRETILNGLNCAHANIYKNQTIFQFLPGHRIIILKWPATIPSDKNSNEADQTFTVNHPAFSPICREIISSALTNYKRDPKGRTFSDLLMKFSIYVYLLAGKSSYEVISSNLPMPKAGTILKHIHNDKERIIEGELRCTKLVDYLERTNSPKSIFLSEDASGIVKKIIYDARSNQLIGLVLPFNETNGMPKLFSFEAKTAADIETYVQLEQSHLVYIICAQPLKRNVAPFILQIFGTNNKFNTENVLKRWNYTVSELNACGIDVLGISADGDERLLSAMKRRMRLDLTTVTNLSQFSTAHPINVQDTIHIGTKLRNRFLNTSILLQIGNMTVTVTHIIMMLSEVPKEIHGLVLSDVCPEDRQNFASFEKITQPRVLQSLDNHIADSKATVMYLVLCKQITSSFLDVNLEPMERIYKIWNAVYFLRCWRKWIILPDNNFSIDKNFISSNAYACAELNAHSLIYLIVSLRMQQHSELFLPYLFSSQPCEHTFRQMRSMGTTNYTKINFTLNELLHMLARVDMMNKIMYSTKEITFPKIVMKSKIVEQIAVNHSLPNDEDILSTMSRAKKDALKDAAQFGMIFSEHDIETCDLQVRNYQIDETEIEEDFFDWFEQSIQFEGLIDANEVDKFVEVIDPDGSTRHVRKSTFVWLLCDSKDKLSSDRLKRVQSRSESSGPTPKRFKSSAVSNISLPLFKANELEIGEWALFELNDKASDKVVEARVEVHEQNFMCNFLIGVVVGFRLTSKKKSGEIKHKKQCRLKFVSINPPNSTDKNTLQVLCVWYTCDQTGNLHLVQNKTQKSIYISNYVATMKNPINKKDQNSGNVTYVLPYEYSELKLALLQLLSPPGTSHDQNISQ